MQTAYFKSWAIYSNKSIQYCLKGLRTVLAPLTTVVAIQNLLFETPEVAVFQEWLQFKNYLLLVFQHRNIIDTALFF